MNHLPCDAFRKFSRFACEMSSEFNYPSDRWHYQIENQLKIGKKSIEFQWIQRNFEKSSYFILIYQIGIVRINESGIESGALCNCIGFKRILTEAKYDGCGMILFFIHRHYDSSEISISFILFQIHSGHFELFDELISRIQNYSQFHANFKTFFLLPAVTKSHLKILVLL